MSESVVRLKVLGFNSQPFHIDFHAVRALGMNHTVWFKLMTYWSRWNNIFVEKSGKWIFIIFPFFWLECFSIVIIRSFWNTIDKIGSQIKSTWKCKTQWKITNDISKIFINSSWPIMYDSYCMSHTVWGIEMMTYDLPPHGSLSLFWRTSNKIAESTSSLTSGRELSPCQGRRDSRNHL